MSLLTPLYLLGLLAISLPILFHLIRRTPRGELSFSSLMFISRSPPRLTRRSRLENLFLLILRGLVLALLALAFARPFLRSEALQEAPGLAARRIAILVDTSASMRRGDLWPRARRMVGEVLAETSPADRVVLFTFDEELRALVDFGGENAVPAGDRGRLLEDRLKAAAPTWSATDLGSALTGVAETLLAAADREPGASLEIVLVTDLQEGSRLDPLGVYEWPDRIRVNVKRVQLPRSTNAGLQILLDPTRPEAGDGCRIRITNDSDSSAEQFFLAWAGPGGEPAATVKAYVPPGQSRIVRVSPPPDQARDDRLILTGDDHDFDNTLFVAPLVREEVTIHYLGRDESNDAKGLRYYLERALAGGAHRKIRVVAPPEGLFPNGSPRPVVITEALPEDQIKKLRQYVEKGGTVLCVLRDVDTARSLARLLGPAVSAGESPSESASEAVVPDYALLAEMDFTHPLFAAFADPRYSDFTRIRFWKYRNLDVQEREDLKILARFDSGAPAILERSHGRGRLWMLTSSWQPADSQLALSSKFVPLLSMMLDPRGIEVKRPQYRVNEKIAWSMDHYGTAEGSATIHNPNGTAVELPASRIFEGTDQPGIYRLSLSGRQHRFAVNLSIAESKTAPLDIEELARRGVVLGARPPSAEAAALQRQLKDREIENRQKFWLWLIAGVLVLLMAETWLAGWLSTHSGTRAAPESGVSQ